MKIKKFEEFINESNKGSYEDYIKKVLKKYNVKSPSELSKDKKKKFYDELDAGWESEEEKSTGKDD